MAKRFRISIRGVVQGVGFRPFVYNLARSYGISGFVTNTSEGVLVEAEADDLRNFIVELRRSAPALARIDSIESEEIQPSGDRLFVIKESETVGSFTHISPDISICSDCLKELLDPADRRYRYPFINCTNCGPRYTITKKVPYDRQNTTMSGFRMCEKCEHEYHNPVDRRFHAQPNACPVCGPSVKLISEKYPDAAVAADPVNSAVRLLKQGAIIALKGIGGFHLCCDALNEGPVRRLRSLKRKSNKPFALMASCIDEIKKHSVVSDEESAILLGSRRPVMLLKKSEDYSLPEVIAPNNSRAGFMLPYTPLHCLLFNDPDVKIDMLVMTSANNAEEPIVIDNDEALSKLFDVADAFLLHNRDIFMRADDSVLMHNERSDSISFIRRARGYTPEAVKLAEAGPDILGAGADLKNSFALAVSDSVIMSQHIGDMDNFETQLFFEETLNNLKAVYNARPEAVACDLHPDYRSSVWAHNYSKKQGIRKISIQHHHAHIASVMAEHGLDGQVIGVAFDGAGYGADGNIWGSEFLVCTGDDFKRHGHFAYLPLPGGDTASKECWRCSLSLMKHAAASRSMSREDTDKFIRRACDVSGLNSLLSQSSINSVLSITDKPQFSPLSSGAGRLFDAVAALVGCCHKNTFEAEAAMALENVIDHSINDAYGFAISSTEPFTVDFSDMLFGVVDDLADGFDKGVISAKFHNTLINAAVESVKLVSQKTGIKTIASSGGVLQNAFMAAGIISILENKGFRCYLNNRVPANDGGIALGQVFVARNLLKLKL